MTSVLSLGSVLPSHRSFSGTIGPFHRPYLPLPGPSDCLIATLTTAQHTVLDSVLSDLFFSVSVSNWTQDHF